MNKMVGKQSVSFSDPPCILGAASICGPKEAEGPLADYFDIRSERSYIWKGFLGRGRK